MYEEQMWGSIQRWLRGKLPVNGDANHSDPRPVAFPATSGPAARPNQDNQRLKIHSSTYVVVFAFILKIWKKWVQGYFSCFIEIIRFVYPMAQKVSLNTKLVLVRVIRWLQIAEYRQHLNCRVTQSKSNSDDSTISR